MSERDGDGPGSAGSGAIRDSRLGLLRELGEQAVLEAIFRRGPVTRPEIASATGLCKPTVGAAVGRLEQAGMISAIGPQHGRRGRSPSPMSCAITPASSSGSTSAVRRSVPAPPTCSAR